MIIIEQSLKSINFNNQPKAVALGNFDGVHLGHRQLIEKLIEISNENKLKSLLFTFNNHSGLIAKNSKVELLSPLRQKIQLLSQYDLDYLYLMDFNINTANLSPEEFVVEVLIRKLNVKHIIVGFNYRFGKAALGNAKDLEYFGQIYGFSVTIIPPFSYGEEVVSSSLIRNYIKDGDVEYAVNLLGRPYFIAGKVTKGKEKGRELGFPTANVEFQQDVMIPANGVYITKVRINDKMYNSITNVGTNPTFNEQIRRAESHIFDFNRSLYKHHIEIYFFKKLRDEKKFDNVDRLVEQVKLDMLQSKKYFG
jgi:riboflavin kinase / FMN adenylyltransferase